MLKKENAGIEGWLARDLVVWRGYELVNRRYGYESQESKSRTFVSVQWCLPSERKFRGNHRNQM